MKPSVSRRAENIPDRSALRHLPHQSSAHVCRVQWLRVQVTRTRSQMFELGRSGWEI